MITDDAGEPQNPGDPRQGDKDCRQAEGRYRALMEAMLDAVVIVNAIGQIVDANSHAETLFGYQRSELLGMRVETLTPPRYRQAHEEYRRAYVDRPQARHMGVGPDLWAVTKGGREFPVEISLSPLGGGKEQQTFAAIRDISEQRRMQKELRDTARRFRAIFDQTYEFIGLLSPEGRILEANQTALEFGGTTLNEVVGQLFWETPWVDPQAQRHLKAAFQEAAGGKFVRYEAKHVGPDGETHTIDFSLKPVKDEAGRVVLIIPEGRDITERKKAEAIARRARQQLEAVNGQLMESLHLLEEDEAAGRAMQFQLLPEEHRRYDGFEFSCQLLTSTYLSGDFVDYFAIDAAHLGFYIADVSGHGVPSALVTVLLKSYMNRYLEAYHQNGDSGILDPAETLERLNRELYRARLGKYLTMFYGVVDRPRNELQFANGGQFPFPILCDAVGARYLPCKSLPVGLFDFAHYHPQHVALAPGFALVLISDGILEMMPQSTLKEKEERLLAVSSGSNISVASLMRGLEIDHSAQPPDDITFLLLRREP